MLEYKSYSNFKIEKPGFTNSRISLNLEYFNPNNFGLQLRRSELDIFIDNNFLGHSSFDTLINIPRKSNFILPVKFDADMKNLYKNAFNTVFNKELLIKVTGQIKVGKANVFMSMPVNYEGKHKFTFF